MTDAILYPEVCTLCTLPNGKHEYCQCTRRNAVASFNSIETAVMTDDITPGMRAATIIMSIVGPAFLIVYALADWMYYKKTGRPLALY